VREKRQLIQEKLEAGRAQKKKEEENLERRLVEAAQDNGYGRLYDSSAVNRADKPPPTEKTSYPPCPGKLRTAIIRKVRKAKSKRGYWTVH